MNLWQRLSNFFEHGDLTPFAVVISIAHYVPVLQAHGENLIVAALVGTLIDLLHFRTIRKAVNDYRHIDGGIAVLTTTMATAYHLRYYGNDWLLALPIPIGIAILAYHAASNVDSVSAEEAQALSAEINALSERVRRLTDANKLLTDANSELTESNRRLSTRINALSKAPRVLLDVVSDFARHGTFNGSADKYQISATDQKRIMAIVNRNET